MSYGDFKNLRKRTASDKVMCNKAVSIAKYPKKSRLNGLYVF